MANYNLTQTGDEVQAYIDSIPVIDVTGTLSGSTITFGSNPYSQIAANYAADCSSIIRLTVGTAVYLLRVTQYDGTNYTAAEMSGAHNVVATIGSSSASATIDAGIDATPTQGSDNLVKSGGVWSAIDNIPTSEVNGESVNRLSADFYNTGQNTDLNIIAAAHFPTTANHTYRFIIKSNALLKENGSDTVNIGIGDVSASAISTTAQNIFDGYSVDKTFSTHAGRRVFIRSSNYIVGVVIHIEIYDLTTPTSMPLEVVTLPLSDEVIDKVGTLDLNIDNVKKRNIYIGKLCQYATYNQGLLNKTNISAFNVSMEDALILPKRGITLYLKSPQYVKLQITSGSWMPQYSTSSNYIENGGSFTFPNDSISYRLSFIRGWEGETNTIPILVSEVEAWLASGELEVYYYDEASNIIDRNDFAPILAIVGDKDTSVYPKSGQTNTGLPTLTFIHASDFHSDVKRMQNVLSLADYLKADGAILTGDFVGMKIDNGMAFVPNIINSYKTPSVVCVGNHDTNGASANSDVFDALLDGLVTPQDYEASSGVAATNTWFYRDFATQKIRVISLNVYETNHTSFDATFISQAQIDWLVATLGSIPAGYGVIMAYHVSEVVPTAIAGHEEWQSNISTPSGFTNTPIVKIIDAFISKTTLSATFVSHGKSGIGDVTITINADFSPVSSNEFICHCVGHTHIDSVGLVPNVNNRQIMICVTCAIPYAGNSSYKYLANGSTIPRGTAGKTQDAINIIGINRVDKKIGIARVGSDVKYTSLDKLTPFITSYV